MLGAALWFVVVLVLLVSVVLDGAATFARATVQTAADHALEGAMHDAVADYENRLQSAIARTTAPLAPAGAFAGAAPSLEGYASALAALPDPVQGSSAASPVLTVTYSVTPTTLAAPNCGPDGAPLPDAIGWLQCSGMVQESRISLHVVAQAFDTAGELLAERDAFVSLRLFAEPPYSAAVGNSDAAADAPVDPDALVGPPHEGDVGGATVSGPAAAAALAAPPLGGTSIHVRYECHDGAGHCTNAAPPDPDAALAAGSSWSNGNRPQP